MKSRRLAAALGLAALLLIAGSVVGCSSARGERPANPMEEMEKPGESYQTWDREPLDIPGYPEGMPVANGIVQKVTANTLDLGVATGEVAEMARSPSGCWEYEPGTETKIVQVVFTPDVKVYRWAHRVDDKPELVELTLSDLEVGEMIMVWGEESGGRIFADTIIIGM